MTDLIRLKTILSNQIDIYNMVMTSAEYEGMDRDVLVYDEAQSWFNELRRGDFAEILEILSREE